MAVVQQLIPAPPERIFEVLADGWSYSDWVVGTAHIRDVDADWPAPGSQIYHQAGVWPIKLRDKTVVVSSDPPRELVMRPHLWPLGELVVRFTLTPVNERETQVTLEEEMGAGPLRWLRTKVDDLVMHHRNREALSRLSDLATRRERKK
jgi:uncharacterized protein YndB with AHSA1/START domain